MTADEARENVKMFQINKKKLEEKYFNEHINDQIVVKIINEIEEKIKENSMKGYIDCFSIQNVERQICLWKSLLGINKQNEMFNLYEEYKNTKKPYRYATIIGVVKQYFIRNGFNIEIICDRFFGFNIDDYIDCSNEKAYGYYININWRKSE